MTRIYGTVMFISFLALVISMTIDRRKFRNGVFLLIFVMSSLLFFFDFLSNHGHSNMALYLFLLVSLAITLIVPIVLVLNGLVMIKREGRSLPNLLSLLFGIFITVGAIILIRALYHSADEPTSLWRVCFFIIGFGVFYVSLVFLAFMFYTWLIKIIGHRKHYDYVIILGAGLLDGNRISKLLADRLDKGAKVFALKGQGGKIICSGGQGHDETVSEAQAMKEYLVSKGIDEKDIIMEDKSINTMENLTFCKEIIDREKPRASVVIVTNGYHVLRALLYSSRIGMDADGIGAHTALYYWPSAMIREYAAIVKYNIVPYTLIFVGLTAWLIYVLKLIR